ncbi:DUF4232 domain-containing protein [Streptomyces sp. A7024]|uniref:DUF4232 domain-containing protein n=1 Tax=Streptomyces coryli TaxID=1128680 RepID=A0A6G4TT28_9ACTN|nr:DUF4232 domain-containing protein [Streptomyces coryli]NGN62932.1 DUF4232 domain-containing protein [Streptomyces coryli]
MKPNRTRAALAALAATGLLASGCAQTAGSRMDGQGQMAANGTDGTPWCATSDLSASLRQLNPAAGNRYTVLVLTNTSGHSCRTQGWPGLQLVDADGRNLHTMVIRDRSRTPKQLTLTPGDSAWSGLHTSQVPGEADPVDGGCRPEPERLEVIPPDSRTRLEVAWVAGEVCNCGRIDAWPLREGWGPRD